MPPRINRPALHSPSLVKQVAKIQNVQAMKRLVMRARGLPAVRLVCHPSLVPCTWTGGAPQPSQHSLPPSMLPLGHRTAPLSAHRRSLPAAVASKLAGWTFCTPPPPGGCGGCLKPVRKIIPQMHTPAHTSQCWSRQTPAWTRRVHLDAPGQRHGQQPRLWDSRPPE